MVCYRAGDENKGMDMEGRRKKGRSAAILLLHWLAYHLELLEIQVVLIVFVQAFRSYSSLFHYLTLTPSPIKMNNTSVILCGIPRCLTHSKAKYLKLILE